MFQVKKYLLADVLKRQSKMRIDNFELFLDNDKEFYMAGDEVIGHIEFDVNRRVRIARLTIQLTGIVHTCWRERVSVYFLLTFPYQLPS